MEDNKLYHYFVSYQFNDSMGLSGFGQVEAHLDKPITTMYDIQQISDALKGSLNNAGIVILYYQLLRVSAT